MKPYGKCYEQQSNHGEIHVLQHGVLGLNPAELTDGLGHMAIVLVEKSCYGDQCGEDDRNSDPANG